MANMVANIKIIVAVSEDNCIGKDNDLPWHLPIDLARFKELTKDNIVIMGRKCWESIPEKFRPLPERTNVVITRNKDYVAEGAEVRHDFAKALDEFSWGSDKDVYIIGGAEIYKEGFKYANHLELTRVMAEVNGDTFLEGLEPSDWLMIGFEGPYQEDDLDFRFETYKRKQQEDK
jgi:dihydrofolate reductase